jgi:hypothetical protein
MSEETPLPDNTPPANFPVITNLQMAAADLHEMYLSLLWSGFTEKQALHIVGVAVSHGMLSPYIVTSQENKDYVEGIDFDEDEDGF